MSDFLETSSAVFEALGGYAKVAKLTGRQVSAVYMWTNGFPSNTYVVMTEALAEIGKSAPAALWGMTQIRPDKQTSAAAS
jgi:hypothetical protein